jgi:hypothetical protein
MNPDAYLNAYYDIDRKKKAKTEELDGYSVLYDAYDIVKNVKFEHVYTGVKMYGYLTTAYKVVKIVRILNLV